MRLTPGLVLKLCVALLALGLTPSGLALLTATEIEEPPLVGQLAWAAVLTLCLGLVALQLAPRASRLGKLLQAGLICALLTALLGELGLRTLLALELQSLRNPGLYADAGSSGEYWKLQRRWILAAVPDSYPWALDSDLGWVPAVTAENPLGVISDTPYQVDYDAPVVLFYGDSFIQGTTAVRDAIPQQLGGKVTRTVYNYGVVGYGVDQILRRVALTSGDFSDAQLVVGLFSQDIDRVLCSMRVGPKPYYAVENGQPVLRGFPVEVPAGARAQALDDQVIDQWLTEHPPRIKSYALAMLLKSVRAACAMKRGKSMYARPEKELVCDALLEEFFAQVRSAGRDPVLVLFYPKRMISAQWSWREKYLTKKFDESGYRWIDVKQLLNQQAAKQQLNPLAFFGQDGHLNALGNGLVATAVARELEDPGPR